jgi:hypothetical protein
LHRIGEASLANAPAAVPPGFKLDAYIASEAFGFLLGTRPLRLRVLFDPNVAAGVVEAPLADNQQVSFQAGESTMASSE